MDGQSGGGPETERRRLRYGSYLRWMLLPLCFVYLLPFVLLRLPGYRRWSPSYLGPILEYGFEAAGENADVVVFGDSTALFNLDPRRMSAALGVKAINLPNTVASLTVEDDLALRHYLAKDRPPRMIVLYFSPWDTNYAHDTPVVPPYEGEEMLVRHGTLREAVGFAMRHPVDTVLFPLEFFQTNTPVGMVRRLLAGQQRPEVTEGRGHVPYRWKFERFGDTCKFPERFLTDFSTRSVEELAARYRTPGTKVLVYLSPIPACANVGTILGRGFESVGAAKPRTMPPSDFWIDGYMSHLDAGAVGEATDDLVEAVKAGLAEGR